MEDSRCRLLIPLLLLSACNQAQSGEVSEVNGGGADHSLTREPTDTTPARSADGAPGPTAMAPVEMGEDGGAPKLDSEITSPSEGMSAQSIPEWEAGVPAELATDSARCVRTSAASSTEACHVAIECHPRYNPGRLMNTCTYVHGDNQHVCTCVWIGIESHLSVFFFKNVPYPGDGLEPCVASMEECARLHTE